MDEGKRVLVVQFEDTFGPLYNLLKHLGCQPDTLFKAGTLYTVEPFDEARLKPRGSRLAQRRTTFRLKTD